MQQLNKRLHPQLRTSNNTWPLIALILAACGGGGGGGAPVIRAAVTPTGKRLIDVPEGQVAPTQNFTILTPAEESRATTDLTVRNITIDPGGYQVQITYDSPSGAWLVTARLQGPDASFFKFVKNNSGVEFRQPPDYERPLDTGRDNIYDFTIAIMKPSAMPYYFFLENISGIQIRVTDVVGVDDPTPPSAGARQQTFAMSTGVADGLSSLASSSDVMRRFKIHEGETIVAANVQADVNAYIPREGRYQRLDVADDGATANLIFRQSNGAEARVTYTLSGADAHLFKLADVGKAGTFGGIAFRNAPDYEAPQDSGGNNEYNFVLTVAGDLATFTRINIRVRVTDIAGDADPTPPSAGASQQIMDTTFDDLAMANDNLPPNDADII